ncbi:MAG: hypothetical protein AAGJ18_21005 [Bacteroidota bacterium]
MNDTLSIPTRTKDVYPSYYELMQLLPSSISKSFLADKLLVGFSVPSKLKDVLYTPDTVRLFDWTETQYDKIRVFDRTQKRLIAAIIIWDEMELQQAFWKKIRAYRKEVQSQKAA